MQNILVPTDFSACAANAADVAIGLAAFYKTKLHLFTQVNIPSDWNELSEMEKNQFPECKQQIHNAEILFKEWIKKGLDQNVEVITSWKGGKLVNSIQNYVKENEIDFIVMGSHGASGKNEFFIGSNTQKVVRTVHCPVLVIKDELSNYNIKKVVFASNFDLAEQQPFQYLLDFAKPFKPEIHLLSINTSSWFGESYILVKSAMDDFAKMCKGLKCETHFYRDWSIEAGIRHLSNEINADLIVISNQNRSPLKRLLFGSNVEALINHTTTPVLSIDFSDQKGKEAVKELEHNLKK